MQRRAYREYLQGAATWPNALTLGRLAASPFIAYQFYKNPKQWAGRAGLIGLTDNLDGALARLGGKDQQLAKLGFRGSEFGRKADPITDKIYNGQLIAAAMCNEVLDTAPLKLLGLASVAQKMAVGVQTYEHEQQGIELSVRPMGKVYEFITNVGLGTVALAEHVDDETRRRQIKRLGATVGAIGIAGATYETIQYSREAAATIERATHVQTDRPAATELV